MTAAGAGRRLAVPLLALALAACTPIAERYDQAAGDAGLARREIDGAGFRHAVYAPAERRAGKVLHIYIEGDGTPFLRPTIATADPTPRRPLMPALMALDPATVLLLGRPCHHGLAKTPPCRPETWAGQRFSGPVVDSMAAAARRLIAEGGHRSAVLIGHSGGGVLALLMAGRMPEVRAAVAVASVVDLDLWTRHHGLAPLVVAQDGGDGDPARRELFLAGAEDRVSPAALVREAAAGRANVEFAVYPGFDHACCWARAWPDTLAWIARAARER